MLFQPVFPGVVGCGSQSVCQDKQIVVVLQGGLIVFKIDRIENGHRGHGK